MGLFDTLAKNALGSMLGGGSRQDPAAMLSGLLSEAGGMEGLMSQFQSAGFGGQLYWGLLNAHPSCPVLNLRDGLFARDIDRFNAARGGTGDSLQQQGRFADAGITADQNGGGFYQATATHTVEFANASC